MAQYFPWCGCCTQCTRRYNFDDSSDSMDVAQFRAYDDPDGTTPVTVHWDSVTEELDIEGEGCYAVELTPASVTLKTIHVAVMVAALTSGSVGVTIRRPESDESISLWWLGGTSYELRHGTTVLESITHTAATDEIKLELTTPKDPTTDVLVYIGGALVHTEAAVAFVMPDVLNLGVAIDGEATVDWVEVSPCPTDCEVVSYCYDNIWDDTILRMPRTWYASIPWPSDHGFTDCDTLLVDFLYPREAWFIPATDAVFYNHDIEAWDDWGGCGFVPVTPHRVTIGDPQYTVDPYNLPPLPSDKWPVEYGGTCVGDTLIPYYNSAHVSGRSVHSWRFNVEFQNVGTLGSPIVEYRVRVHISDRDPISNMIVEHVVYASSWIPIIGNETLDSDLTLTLIANSSPYTGWDSTITLTPDGPSEAIVRYLAKCGDLCEPPVTPQPGGCYLINLTLADEDGGAWDYSLPLGLQYDKGSGSWYWEGGSLSAYPYVHDTCGPLPEFDIKIHCVEPEEGASKQWVMDFTTSGGSDRYPMTWFDMEETIPEFEGTTDLMCSGQTWDLYAFNLRLETTEYQFGSCSWSACATPTSPIILADISASCSGESGSGGASGPLVFQASSSLPVGVDPGDVSGLSFWSPLPSSLNTGILKMAFLYVENGTAKIQITDVSGNPIPDMDTTVSYSCDPSDGKPAFVDTSETLYNWGFPGPYTTNQFGLCDGESSGFGGWEVTFP